MATSTFTFMSTLALCACAQAVACSANHDDSQNDSRIQKVVALSKDEGRIARGGRLFDKFYVANAKLDFTPDDESTIGLADGEGGPNSEGTLNDANKKRIFNDSGHDYRMKNFFGWDLRGSEGIYGSSYQDKGGIVDINLIDGSLSREDLAQILITGRGNLPIWGDVLSDEDLAHVVEFITAMSDGRIAKAEDIWKLSKEAPNNYTLRSGGDASSGATAIAKEDSCGSVDCHGSKGTSLLIEDKYSLGSFVRANADEGWFKVMVGHPGSPMGPQIDLSDDADEQATRLLDLFAALCDRDLFPPHSKTGADVEDNDERCGDYLR